MAAAGAGLPHPQAVGLYGRKAHDGVEVQIGVCPVKKVQGGNTGQKNQHVPRASQSLREKGVGVDTEGPGRQQGHMKPLSIRSVFWSWLSHDLAAAGQVLTFLSLSFPICTVRRQGLVLTTSHSCLVRGSPEHLLLIVMPAEGDQMLISREVQPAWELVQLSPNLCVAQFRPGRKRHCPSHLCVLG